MKRTLILTMTEGSPNCHFFEGKRLTKIEAFKEDVRAKVLNGQIDNNFELLDFVYEQGHIGAHAAECLKEMKKRGDISFDGTSPLVTYDNVYKNQKKIEYQILKHG